MEKNLVSIDEIVEQINQEPGRKEFAERHDRAEARYENMLKSLVNQRKQSKISQGEMANALGVSQARISQLEKGVDPFSVHTLLMYADVLGCQVLLQMPAVIGRPRVRSARKSVAARKSA